MKSVLRFPAAALVGFLLIPVGCSQEVKSPPPVPASAESAGHTPSGPSGPPKVDIDPDSGTNPMTTSVAELRWLVDGNPATQSPSADLHPRFTQYALKRFEALHGNGQKPVKKLEIVIKNMNGQIVRTIGIERVKQGSGDSVKWFLNATPVGTSADAPADGLPKDFFIDTALRETWEMVADNKNVSCRNAKIHFE